MRGDVRISCLFVTVQHFSESASSRVVQTRPSLGLPSVAPCAVGRPWPQRPVLPVFPCPQGTAGGAPGSRKAGTLQRYQYQVPCHAMPCQAGRQKFPNESEMRGRGCRRGEPRARGQGTIPTGWRWAPSRFGRFGGPFGVALVACWCFALPGEEKAGERAWVKQSHEVKPSRDTALQWPSYPLMAPGHGPRRAQD